MCFYAEIGAALELEARERHELPQVALDLGPAGRAVPFVQPVVVGSHGQAARPLKEMRGLGGGLTLGMGCEYILNYIINVGLICIYNRLISKVYTVESMGAMGARNEELLLPLRAKVLLHREGLEYGHPRRGELGLLEETEIFIACVPYHYLLVYLI